MAGEKLASDNDDLDAMLDAQLEEALAQALANLDINSIDNELEKTLAGIDLSDDLAAQFPTFDEEASLDMQINEALALDKEATVPDATLGIEDFVKSVDVYADDRTDYVIPEKPNRFAKLSAIESISPKFLLAVAAVLTVFVVTAVALSASMYISSNRAMAEYDQLGNIIRVGSSVSNNAGFIFTDTAVDFINKEIILTKINMSRISTVLYFDGFIDLDIYDVFLTDNWGRTYYIDYSYYEHELLKNLIEDQNRGDDIETRLWFDSQPLGFKFFDLIITERDTGISTQQRFSAGQDFTLEPARYLNDAAAVDCGNDEIEVLLTNAVFSNTGSQIGYAIRQAVPGEEIILCKPGFDERFVLKENGKIVVRDSHSFTPVTFDNFGITLGRIDFVPLQNLNSTVRIHFDDMYRKVTLTSEICLNDIFYTKPAPEHVIDFGPYRLVIELGGVQGNQFVLVMHTVDTSLDGESEFSHRVQAFPEVTMVARKKDGSSVRIEPRLIRDSQKGTDVVFDGRTEREFLLGMSTEQIFFEISSVFVKLPPVQVELDLENAERRLSTNPSAAIENIDLMFNRRLEYKTGLYRIEELDRFSENVLKDKKLMSNYKPTTATDTSSVVHVPMWYLEGDRFFSVVRETWRAQPSEFFHKVHKTVAELGERGWIVVEDEIIPEQGTGDRGQGTGIPDPP